MAWPDGMTLIPPLFVEIIQFGLSPVKNIPEYVVPGDGEVTKGINAREIRFCSANTVFSISSWRRMSKACDASLTNLTGRKDVLAVGKSLGTGVGSASYTASCPERKKTCIHRVRMLGTRELDWLTKRWGRGEDSPKGAMRIWSMSSSWGFRGGSCGNERAATSKESTKTFCSELIASLE